jgi:outer membrane protein assembly factor BamB
LEPAWTFAKPFGDPVIGPDGTIYVSSFDEGFEPGYLYAVKPDGSLKWRWDPGGFAHFVTGLAAAVGPDGTVYAAHGTFDPKLSAINPANGTTRWSYATAHNISNFPTVGPDGTIYLGSSGNDAGNLSSGYLYAFNLDGTVKWRWDTGCGIFEG